mgnify:CR=1 FL=1
MTPSALDSLLGAVSVMKPQGTNLLPLQGVLQIAIIPRAMPWAKSFWAFSPFQPYSLKFFVKEFGDFFDVLPSALFGCKPPCSEVV